MSTNKSTESANQPNQQQYYPSKTLTDQLDISGSTLRKWCIALEEKGYEFARTEQNRRLFTKDDLNVLEHLKTLIREKNMSLDNASIIVASMFNDDRSPTGTPSVREENNGVISNEVIHKLTEHIEQQEKFNQELLKRLDEQNDYINKRLDQRDKLLMETLRDLNKQRKEEIKLLEQANEDKGNWFTRLFKK